MKLNILLRSALLGAALTASSLFANTVYIYATGNDGGLGGGEFAVHYLPENDWSTPDFYTFCLEGEVDIDLPGTYDYTVGLATLSQNDVLSVGSAWLYAKFFTGTLSGPAPASSYGDDQYVNAGLLQQAFWYLEGESGGVNNYYVGLVSSAFGSLAAAQADIDASSKVKVMNLWGANGLDVQDVLVYVPDSGMTALLLGLGLLSLAAFRRKL